jgi:hypothetical protein
MGIVGLICPKNFVACMIFTPLLAVQGELITLGRIARASKQMGTE